MPLSGGRETQFQGTILGLCCRPPAANPFCKPLIEGDGGGGGGGDGRGGSGLVGRNATIIPQRL